MRLLDAQAVEPGAPPASGTAGPRPVAERPLVYPDRPGGPDEWGRSADAAFLAEVLLHRRVETPLCLGLFGAPGAGKTTVLDQIADAAALLGRAAAGRDSPFGADPVIVRVDAARPGDPGDPGAQLAAAVRERLGTTHPALAEELAHAGVDATDAARRANEALNEQRRRHEAERQTLNDLTSRDGRLAESVVEASGTALDGYARSRRSAIESTLRAFGFATADPIATFKDLAREAAEQRGWIARAGLCLRSLWAYRGQGRRLVLAVLFFALAWIAAALVDNQDSWLAALRGLSDKAGPVADWAAAHVGWLATLHTLALLGCLLALASAAWRAARFLRPIFKGASLLERDLAGRRRDLQSILAHQTRLVDGLASGVGTAARRASEADRRAATSTLPESGVAANAGTRLPETTGAAFFAALSAAMTASGDNAAPRRLVLLIDDLDLCSAAAAAAMLDAVRRLTGPGIVCVVAGSRSHLLDGFSETDPAQAIARLDRCVQVGYRIDAGQAEGARATYAGLLTGSRPPTRARDPEPALDAGRSALDRPWRPREAETLAALSIFAGETPRAVKRYVNLYRIARADPRLLDAPAPVFTALALALALDSHGSFEELDALIRASQGENAGGSPLLRRALDIVLEAAGEPVEIVDARRALDVAGRYAARG